MRKVGLLVVATLLVIVFGNSAALANPLPAGVGSIQCETLAGGGPTFITDPVSCNGGNDSGLVTYAPFAGVSGSAFGQGLVDVATVIGTLNYSFEVTGGHPGDVVPVNIAAVLLAIPNGIGVALSEIGVSANTSASVAICGSGCGAGSGQTGFTGTLQVDALSGAVDTLGLEIEAGGARGDSSDFDGGMASADPFLFVDPSFAKASDYSIEVSPNIGNVAESVPEPSSLAVLAVGLVAIAGLRRRWSSGPQHESALSVGHLGQGMTIRA